MADDKFGDDTRLSIASTNNYYNDDDNDDFRLQLIRSDNSLQVNDHDFEPTTDSPPYSATDFFSPFSDPDPEKAIKPTSHKPGFTAGQNLSTINLQAKAVYAIAFIAALAVVLSFIHAFIPGIDLNPDHNGVSKTLTNLFGNLSNTGATNESATLRPAMRV